MIPFPHPFRRPLHAARFRLRRVRDVVPLTPSGGGVLLMSVAAIWLEGIGTLDLILLTAGVLLGLLVLVLMAATPLAVLLVRRRLREARGRALDLECGAWQATGFSGRAPRWLPFLYLRVAWSEPSAVDVALEGARGAESVRPLRRGLYRAIERRLTLGDVLGLTAVTWTSLSESPVQILPARSPLNRPEEIRGIVGGEDLSDPWGRPSGDRVDMRKYGHGDSPRMILWKIYAHSRRLFVRVPERAVEAAPRICAYLVSSPDDEPAASLARSVLELGLLGEGWRFGADGAEDAETLPEALRSLALSGAYGTTAPTSLPAFLDRAERDGFGACVLFLPPRVGAWTEGVRTALSGIPMRVRAVLAVPGWLAPEPHSWWRTMFLTRRSAPGASPAEVARLVASLEDPALQFVLADVASGDVMADPQAFLARLAAGGREVA